MRAPVKQHGGQLNAPDFHFEYLIESIRTNASLCCSKCSCSSGSIPTHVQETKDADTELEEAEETKINKKSVMYPGVTDLTLVPISDGETSGGNLAPTVIDKKSQEKENLSEDPSHGHSDKASAPDFETNMLKECIH